MPHSSPEYRSKKEDISLLVGFQQPVERLTDEALVQSKEDAERFAMQFKYSIVGEDDHPLLQEASDEMEKRIEKVREEVVEEVAE